MFNRLPSLLQSRPDEKSSAHGGGGFTLLVLLGCAALPCAQAEIAADLASPHGTMRAAQAVRVAEGPVVDGRLDDPVWGQAPIASGLTRYEPWVGGEMRETTHVRVLFDDDNLYLGFWCFDSDPAGIIRRGMERDGSVLVGDHVQFLLDPFLDRRNGYAFGVSPDGGRWDALVSDNLSVNTDWDGIWEAKTSIGSDGWKAEVRIPFRSLSHQRNLSEWGFNFARSIPRIPEKGRWRDPRPETSTIYPSAAGTLEGLSGLSTNLGIEFTPYVAGRYRSEAAGATTRTMDAGFDLGYQLSPGLAATFSYNTDFAETEADLRQINFSRFPLFFAEKRDFFLAGSDLYSFASLNQNLLVPYYTRRIGLTDSGEVVPIVAAGRLTGRVRDTAIAFTGVRLESTDTIEGGNVYAARVSQRVFEESSIGLLGTYGEPDSAGTNAVAGFDFNFHDSRFAHNRILAANLFALGSWSTPEGGTSGSGHAWGAALNFPNEPFACSLQFAEISEGFDPGLGFVRRTGVRSLRSNWKYLVRQPEGGALEWWSMIYGNMLDLSMEGTVLTTSHSVYPLAVRLASGDQLSIGFTRTFDRTDYTFTVADQAAIEAGRYWMSDVDIQLTLSERRAVSGELSAGFGTFYGGDRAGARASLWVVPGRHVVIGAGYEFNRFVFPAHRFDTRLANASLVLRFTPRLRWANLVQYDSVSETIGFSSRVYWEVRPGQEIHLAANENSRSSPWPLERLNTELSVKCSIAFRF